MKRIEVVIPVVNYDLALTLLDQIESNTHPVTDVHIVDNTGKTHLWSLPDTFNLHFYFSKTGLVNESLELGRTKVSKDCDFVAFLNDDLIIGNWFFQRLVETFESNSTIGIACGNTNTANGKGCNFVPGSDHPMRKGTVDIRLQRPRYRMDGWAFAIRKEILDKIPPIPHERITTFCGDTWLFEHMVKLGYCWAKDYGNNLFHYVGMSTLKGGFRDIKKSERNEWDKIRAETWG